MAESNGRPVWANISFGNVLALVAVIGGTIAVYTEIRSTQSVATDRIAVLSREIASDRIAAQAFADQMRNQLTQLSKDIAFLQGQIAAAAQKK
jgi:hypothetical protein